MVRRTRSRAGYTLVEALLTVAVLGILFGLGANLLMSVNRYFLTTRTRLDLQRQARSMMYVMTREIRQAQNSTIVIDRLNISQPPCSRITFTKPNGTVVSYWQNGNQLQTSTITGGKTFTSTLSTSMGYLAFTVPRSDDMTIMSLSMTLQELTFQGQVKSLHTASQQIQVMN
jgi:type II secretory pathway pseudopilin PulG